MNRLKQENYAAWCTMKIGAAPFRIAWWLSTRVIRGIVVAVGISIVFLVLGLAVKAMGSDRG